MEKKTHIACASLISLSLIKPSSIQELLITIGVSALGGVLPDVDLKDSTSDKLFDRLMPVGNLIFDKFVQYFSYFYHYI